MHPILRDPRRLALYLAAWGLIGILLAALAALIQNAPLPAALCLLVPPTLLFGLICLSAWWVCRAAPLEKTSWIDLSVGFLRASVQASAVWAGVSTPWAVLMSNLH